MNFSLNRMIVTIIRNKIVKWLLVISCMLGIFSMSHLDSVKSWFITGRVMVAVEQQADVVEEKDFEEEITYYSSQEDKMLVYRKIAHVIEFFVLVLLWINALYGLLPLKRCILTSFMISVLYAVFDEVHQLFIVGRTGTLKDVFIDSIGIVLGVSLALFIIQRINKRFVSPCE